jgi:putative FmdB family regulatory protein
VGVQSAWDRPGGAFANAEYSPLQSAPCDTVENAMPIYEYKCAECSHTMELLQKVTAPPPTVCPNCGKPALVKQVTAAGFHLKGSGWYVTDFRDSGTAKKDGKKDVQSDTAADSKAESAAAESKAGVAKDAAASSSASPGPAPSPAPTAAPPAAASGSGSGTGSTGTS